MKKLILIALAACTLGVNAQDFPKPSPLAKTYQKVGLTDVEIEYSSPAVKGRTIFGDVVPTNKLWRTGANDATILTFSEKVTFGDIDIQAGKYSLFSIPGDSKIQFFLNTDIKSGGTGNYDANLTVATATVDFTKTKTNVERLMFTIENTTTNGADLRMTWADRTCVVPIKVFTEAQAAANFKVKSEEYSNSEFRLYTDAANYYLEIEDAKQAVTNGEKSVELRKMFFNTYTLAKAYQMNGDKAKALATANESLELSKKADYGVYIKRNEALIAELNKK